MLLLRCLVDSVQCYHCCFLSPLQTFQAAPGMVRLTVRRPWTKKAAAVNAGVPEKVQKRKLTIQLI